MNKKRDQLAAELYPLLKIAADNCITTKESAKAALKTAGQKQTLCNELLKAAKVLKERRQDKQDRIARRWKIYTKSPGSTRFSEPWNHTNFCGASLPLGTPTDRLLEYRRGTVAFALHENLGTEVWDDIEVSFTSYSGSVGCFRKLRPEPSPRFWEGVEQHYSSLWKLKVKEDWRVRVKDRGLAYVNGLFTLDLTPVKSNATCEIFAATWLVLDGKHVTVTRGFIARQGSLCAHADTLGLAVTKLHDKKPRHHIQRI